MRFETAVKRATAEFLGSARMRTVGDFVIGVCRAEDAPEREMVVTTWGYDEERIAIPQTRPELIRAKCLAQMAMAERNPDDVQRLVLRYTLRVLEIEAYEG